MIVSSSGIACTCSPPREMRMATSSCLSEPYPAGTSNRDESRDTADGVVVAGAPCCADVHATTQNITAPQKTVNAVAAKVAEVVRPSPPPLGGHCALCVSVLSRMCADIDSLATS